MLAETDRILVCLVGDVQNDGIEYADADMKILLDWGGLPHIMRNGRAEIGLALAPAGGAGAVPPPLAVFRLSSSGKRLGEVPCAFDPVTGQLSFTARTDYAPDSATYLYEIIR